MEQFLHNLVSTWWGIVIICVVAVALWVLLSALLYRQFFKRFYDIVLSGMALLVLSPILLVLIIVGAINMKGNPFFTQLRPGKNEKIFKLFKFRTMTNERDETGELLPDDVRLTKYGKFLRATSLDEIPELINIFIGNMSIVGPRPQLVRDMVFMTNEQRKRHTVSPGLTGLAQCSGRNNMTWEQKFDYDLQYIRKISLWKDIGIIFMTAFKVFKQDGITEEGEATATDLGDYLLSKGEVSDDKYNELQKEARELMLTR